MEQEAKLFDLKILHVPDLHLYDKEIGVSRGYAQQSLDILESIKDEFISGEYDLVTVGGDIQHAKITNTRYISDFQKELRSIGVLVRSRLREKGLLDKLKAFDSKGAQIDLSKLDSVLFSVRGQHDTNSIEEFTFFDLLIENHILVNPRVVRLEGLQINFLNYSKDINELHEKRHEDTRALISVFHNAIVDNGVLINTIIGKTISPSNHGIFNQVDLALINDIHIPIPMYQVVTGNVKTTVITPGSLGRTSFNASHDRDYGNIVGVTIKESTDKSPTGENIYDMDVNVMEVDLVPSDEFFNKSVAFKKKRVENAFKNFCLEIEEAKINYFDIKEELHKQVDNEEIRNICFEILDQVE